MDAIEEFIKTHICQNDIQDKIKKWCEQLKKEDYDSIEEIENATIEDIERLNISGKFKNKWIRYKENCSVDRETAIEKYGQAEYGFDGKIYILVKPCQSGKTAVLLNYLKEFVTMGNKIINIIVCDNSLMQTQQTKNRANKTLDDGVVELSSKSSYTKPDELVLPILRGKVHTIICCGHFKRLNYEGSISALLNEPLLKEYKFNICIDEADKLLDTKKMEKVINHWIETNKINELICITATPQESNNKGLLSRYNCKLFEIPEVSSENYLHWHEVNYIPLEMNDPLYEDINSYKYSTTNYVVEYLLQEEHKIKVGENIFAPTGTKREAHDEMENAIIENNIADVVIKINGKEKTITIINNDKKETISKTNIEKIKFSEIKESKEQELSHWLGNQYIKRKWNKCRLLMTGHICISRGISLQSKYFMIHRAILGPFMKTMKKSDQYQIAARVLGNTKYFPHFKLPIVICESRTYNIIKKMEQVTIKMATESTNGSRPIGSADWNNISDRTETHNKYWCGEDMSIDGHKLPVDCKDKAYKTLQEAVDSINQSETFKIKKQIYTPQKNSYKPDDTGYIKHIIRDTKKIWSWEEVCKNWRWGINKVHLCRIHPCYLDINDKSTLRFAVVITKL